MNRQRFNCYVLMPFSSGDTDFIFDLLSSLDHEMRYKVEFVHMLSTYTSSALEPTFTIRNADFVLCFFDGKNFNVMYDLGFVHGLRKRSLIALTSKHVHVPSVLQGRLVTYLDHEDRNRALRELALRMEDFIHGYILKPGENPSQIIFLCHRSVDKPHVDKIASRLQGMGYSVWYDELSIVPGDSIPMEISKGLKAATHFIICLSSNTASSEWVTKELYTAVSTQIEEKKLRIIPVFLDDVGWKSRPMLLREYRGVSFYKQPFDEAFEELLRGVNAPPDTT